MKAGLSLIAFPAILWAQAPASVWITAPENRIVAGDSVQLTAVARDGTGRPLTNATCNWTAAANAPFTIGAGGMATAQSLGIGDIVAQCGNARSTIRLQSIPASIVVTPGEKEIAVGEDVAYSARVLDVNGAEIADVPLSWTVVGEDGFNTASVFIGRDGTLTSVGLGRFTVRAAFNYNSPPAGQPGAGPGQFIPQFYGRARLTVRPLRPFRITKLATTADKRDSFLLRPRQGQIAVNGLGQVAFNGSLEGYATGLFLADQGPPRLLLATGEPGIVPGTMITEFSEPAINNRGEVLTTVNYWGSGPGLVLVTPGSAPRFILHDASGFEELRSIYASRLALNDHGTGIFRASYLYTASTARRTGLFQISPQGDVGLVLDTAQALPGIDGAWTFTNDFSVNNDGQVAFTVRAGGPQILYRISSGRIQRIAGAGDQLDGRVVSEALGPVHSLVGGHLAFGLAFTAGPTRLALCPRGDCSPGQIKYLEIQNGLRSVYSVNESGHVAFYGGAPSHGVHVWDGKNSPRPVFLEGRLSPAGSPFTQFYSAGVTANGDVIAQARLESNLFSVVRSSGNRASTLVEAGQTVSATAGMTFTNLVPGDKLGPAHLITGSNGGNVVEVSSRGIFPKLIWGDQVPGGGWYEWNSAPRKTPNGGLLVGTGDSLNLWDAERSVLLARFQSVEGVRVYGPAQFTGNSNGTVAVLNWTSAGPQLLSFVESGALRPLAWIGSGGGNYRTPSPTGGNFEGINQMWVADDGILYCIMRVNGGREGLFSFDGQQWRAVTLVDSILEGRRIQSIRDIRVGGSQVFAQIQLQDGNGIYRLTDGAWTRVIGTGDDSPTGNIINNTGAWDVNRMGHVATALNSGGRPQLALITDSKVRVVLDYSEPAVGGVWLRDPVSVDLRDDGRIFFISRSYKDEMTLYEAAPLF